MSVYEALYFFLMMILGGFIVGFAYSALIFWTKLGE